MHHGAKSKIFEFAAELREEMTEAELLLWDYLKTKPLGLKIRRQHPIAKFILDFYCHAASLSIEVDGGYHTKAYQKSIDAERTEYLKENGIKEYRFTNEEVIKDSKNSFVRINAILREASPFRVGEGGGQKMNEP